MKQRKVAGVLGLTIITLGIYQIVWFVKTKNEMNKMGANIPTAWLLIIPFVSLWWMWKYSEGVEKVTGGKLSTVMCFVLLFLLSIVGVMILQYEFNKVSAAPAAAAGPDGGVPAPVTDTPLPPTPTPTSMPEPPTPPLSTPPQGPAEPPVVTPPVVDPTPPSIPPAGPTAPSI